MNIDTSDADVFTTYDYGLSAVLITKGFTLERLIKTEKRALFVFANSKQIEKVSNAFLANTLDVKARSYFDNLKALKSRLYSAN